MMGRESLLSSLFSKSKTMMAKDDSAQVRNENRWPAPKDGVKLSFLEGRQNQLPLVVSPGADSSLPFLEAWMEKNSKFIDEQLRHYGAILVRGFSIDNAPDMEQLLTNIPGSSLSDTYRGTSPRIRMQGTKYIFSAAEVPVHYPIASHLEMSFLPAPPKRLYFGCLKPSSQPGGETALADFRKVYQDLDPALRDKFLVKGIRYERTHKKKGTYFTYDVSDMLGWPQLFGTDDKAKVEEMCALEGTPVEWKDDETFVSTTHSNAFQLHPETNEPVWFNHTQVFHWTTFPAELWFSFKRCGDFRILIHCIVVTLFTFVKYYLLGHKMGLNATFGDGEPISVKEMHQVREAIHKNMVFSRWQKGDVLILDNFSTSHGRQPTYDKGRKIVVAWADPHYKSNTMTFGSSLGLISGDNPQERTPESTLTRSDSQLLQKNFKDELNALSASTDINVETRGTAKKIFNQVDLKSVPSQPQHPRLEELWR